MTKNLKIIALALVLSISSFGQTNEEYLNTLKRMFEVSGTEESYQAATKQMFSIFKQQFSVGTEIWNELEEEFTKTSIDDLTEMLVPVYKKYMTKEDLEELIKFYETPVGRKFAEYTPMIMQESMQIGQQWGLKIGQDFERKMMERGY
jgi:uncharacterized protein